MTSQLTATLFVMIPPQREPAEVYRTWEQAGLGPESVVDLGDGTSMTLRDLLDGNEDEDGGSMEN